MANYLFLFYGGKATDPKDADKVMAAWMKWFKDMGAAVVDMGAPTTAGKTATKAGVKDGTPGEMVMGYSVIKADNIEAALVMAKKSPQIAAGGTVAVYPAEMM